jgi:copper chaperone CopZ
VSGTVDKANDNSYNEEQILQALGIDAAACAEERSCEMEKTIKVEGMMCHNCENHVKKALEKLEGVVSATADFEKGTAVVVMDKDVEDALLKAAIEEEGYKVVA